MPRRTESIPVDADRGAAGLTRWLHALKTRASLILITAHPDDEDGGMLAFETRGAGARATLLTLNRGEGGQNAMSPDLYDALGLVRTQELLAADRYYGVDQYWTPAIDYGFSKTREEALEKWGHDRVLADVVRVIRMTRPLVVTSVFVGAPTDGHGQHQVAGQMAQEAFVAAGDPNRFPEQIREGLRPWSPLKVYAHVPFFSATPQGMYDYATDKYVPVRFFDYIHKTWSTETPATNLEIAEGDYAPAAGLTYLQIGREGLGFQKSQNDGIAIPPPAAFASAYHRYDSRVPAAAHEKSFFDGIDVSIGGIGSLTPSQPDFLKSGLAEIARLADQASSQYQPDRPQAIAPALADGLSATRALIGRVRAGSLPEPGKSDILFELGVKEEQFEHALAESLGLSLQATVMADRPQGPLGPFAPAAPTFTIGIPGQSFGVQAILLNQSPETVNVEAVSLEASDGKAWKIESRGDARFSVTVPPDAALTRPYFTRPDEEQAYYDLTDPRYRNLSLAPYPLVRNRAGLLPGRRRASFAGGPDRAAHSGPGNGIPAAAGRSRDFRDGGPVRGRGSRGSRVLRFRLHRAQQRERTGARHASIAPARRLAFDAGVGRVLDGSRWRRPDRGLLGSPGFGEAWRAPHHGSRRIPGQELRGRIPAGRLSGFAPLSLLPPRRLPRGGRGREDAGGLAHRLSAGHRRRRAAGSRESRAERPHSGRERRHRKGISPVTTPSFWARGPTPCVPS